MTTRIETVDNPHDGWHRGVLKGTHHRAVVTIAKAPMFRHVTPWRETESEAREDAAASPFADGKKWRRQPRWLSPQMSPDDKACERRAILYAEWLARRDGITLPELTTRRAIWSGVPSAMRSRGGRPIHERRIYAISFGREEDLYRIKKNGKRGARLGKTWAEESRFDLPNWDFNPVLPVDEAATLPPPPY